MSLACSHRLPCPRSTLPPYHERAGPGNKSGLGLGSLSNEIVSGYLASRSLHHAVRQQQTRVRFDQNLCEFAAGQ